jgi:hypothetical protein
MGLPGRPTNDPADYFAFGIQASKDTEVTPTVFPKHLDGSGWDNDPDSERIKEGGDGQETGLSFRTLVKADPQLGVLSRPAIHARLAAGVMGADSIGSAAVASLVRHTTGLSASLPYYTAEQKSGDLIERQGNNVITSLTVEGEAGRPWTTTAQFVGAGTITLREPGSLLTPTREYGKPVFFPYGSYAVDGAASYAQLFTKWKVEVTRSVDDGIQTTGLAREDVIPLAIDVNVDGTIKVTSRDFYRKVQYTAAGSTIPVEFATGSIDFVQNVQVPITGSQMASGLARICVPLLEWNDAKMNKLDPDGKTVYLDVVGMSIKGATVPIFFQTEVGAPATTFLLA